MEGFIEIYKEGKSGKELIFSESNMIVDGAREHVAEMLSFRTSPSGLTTSASLDASNFDIKAMTLGPPEDSFKYRNARFYPSSLMENSDTDKVYNLLPRLNNAQFDTYTRNQISYSLENLAERDDWLDGSPPSYVKIGTPTIYFWYGTTIITSNNVGDAVIFSKDVGDLGPNTNYHFLLEAKSEGVSEHIEGNDPAEFRVYRKRTWETDASGFQYYDFDKKIFDGPAPKGKLIPLTSEKKWHEVAFKTEGTLTDENSLSLSYDYAIELVAPALHEDDKFSKIYFYETRLTSLEDTLLKNSNFQKRDSVFINPDWRRRYIHQDIITNGQEPAAKSLGLYSYEGWWNAGSWYNKVPLFESMDILADFESSGSARFIPSSVQFLDEPAEGYISLKSRAFTTPSVANYSVFLPIKFTAPSSDLSQNWIQDADIDEKDTYNLSFWYYVASTNVGSDGIHVSLRNYNIDDRYIFETSEHSGSTYHRKKWYQYPNTGFGGGDGLRPDTSVSGVWKYFSTDLNIKKEYVDDENSFIVNFRVKSTDANLAEIYFKDVRLSPMVGWYSNANTSSTISYASGGGVDLQFKDSVLDTGTPFHESHLTAAVSGIKESKSYTPVVTYSSPSSTTDDAFDISLFRKYSSGTPVDTNPSQAMFYEWADATGIWASSTANAKITLKGTNGDLVTTSLPPVYGWETLQRETLPITLPNPSFDEVGTQVGDPVTDHKWSIWLDDSANNTGTVTIANNGPNGATDFCASCFVADKHVALRQVNLNNADGTAMGSHKHYRVKFWAKVDDDTSNPYFLIEGARYHHSSLTQTIKGFENQPKYNEYKIFPTTSWAEYEIDFWGDPRGHQNSGAGRFTLIMHSNAGHVNENRSFFFDDFELYEAEGVKMEEEFLLRFQKGTNNNTSATLHDVRFVDSHLLPHTNDLGLESNIGTQGGLWTSDGWGNWKFDEGFKFLNSKVDRTRQVKLGASGTENWVEVYSPFKNQDGVPVLYYVTEEMDKKGWKLGDNLTFSFDHLEKNVPPGADWICALQSEERRSKKDGSKEWTHHLWDVEKGEWEEAYAINGQRHGFYAATVSDWTNWSSDQYDTVKSRTPKPPVLTSVFDKNEHPEIESVIFRFYISPRTGTSTGTDARHYLKNFRIYNSIPYTDTTGLKGVAPSPFDSTNQPVSEGVGKLGHFLNYIEFSGSPETSSMPLDEVIQHGCYLPGSGLEMASSTFGAPASNDFSGVISGTLNKTSVINSDGYILESPVARASQTLADASAGFVVSSTGSADDYRKVKYILTLMPEDWKFLDYYYGGIGSIGLWTVDYTKTLEKIKGENGYPPLWSPSTGTPYNDSLYNLTDTTKNPVFKLFSKKVFFPGGLKIPEGTNYDGHLTIIWGIKF